MGRYPSRVQDRHARNEAATLLDLTHAVGERGPRTYSARARLAAALDLGFTPRLADLAWLRRVVTHRSPTPREEPSA